MADSDSCAFPSRVLDELMPVLEPHEQLVYLRLYRLSRSVGRRACDASVRELSETTNMRTARVVDALSRLQMRGLLAREPGVTSTAPDRFVVASPEELARPVRRVVASPRATASQESEDDELTPGEQAEMYRIRTIAVQLHELNKTDETYSSTDLREDVRETCEAAGIRCTDRLVEEAVGKLGW